jgi:hypothetical protein
MARITRCAEERPAIVKLTACHVVGRDASSDTVIARESVSEKHALFVWAGSGWYLRDLGSRNGTYLNAHALAPRTNTEIKSGDRIAFAENDEIWQVLDTHPPCPMLASADPPATTLQLIDEGGVFVPPAIAEAPWTIFHAGGNWYMEGCSGERRVIDDHESVEWSGRIYHVRLPPVAAETRDACRPLIQARLENASVSIHVSHDEESASVSLEVGNRSFSIERRVHLYLLAYLARARLSDRDPEGGWRDISSVVHALQLSCSTQLAVQVYRCRADFAGALSNPQDVIDRSRRGFMRIGVPADRLSVTRGDHSAPMRSASARAHP